MFETILEKLSQNDASLKWTDLRKDVLRIFVEFHKPLSAYEALTELKKQRKNAEPMTIYRVIEYFIEKNIIHRLSTENKYVFCSHTHKMEAPHGQSRHILLLICKNCLTTVEVLDPTLHQLLNLLAQDQNFQIDYSSVEVNGFCQKCVADHKET